ncbi:MAG: hypothetical protein ACI4KG_02870 [Oscillospiraceae bacterium]
MQNEKHLKNSRSSAAAPARIFKGEKPLNRSLQRAKFLLAPAGAPLKRLARESVLNNGVSRCNKTNADAFVSEFVWVGKLKQMTALLFPMFAIMKKINYKGSLLWL